MSILHGSDAPASRASRDASLSRHRVRAEIQRLILAGQYRPGQRLIQQELARRFGVAQSVVRESLLELQFCGLVEAVDNLGMFVSQLDPRTLIQAYEIREMFEGLAARLCCQRASRADLRELKELAEHNYRLGQEDELESMSTLDREFHYRTVVISGNQPLVKLTEGYRVLGMFVSANRDIRQVRDEHLQIVGAIEADRPDEAEQLARHHVRAAREAIERQVAEGSFVPRWVGETGEDERSKGGPSDAPGAGAGGKGNNQPSRSKPS